jgi:hypothetical protein
MSLAEIIYPDCGPNCTSCGMLCKRADMIDSTYASKLAFMMECLIVDYHGHWQAACDLLDEYKSEWEAINPSPQTFMGEPIPIERKERLKDIQQGKKQRCEK